MADTEFPGRKYEVSRNRSVAGLQTITTGMGREYWCCSLESEIPAARAMREQGNSGVMFGLSNVLLKA